MTEQQKLYACLGCNQVLAKDMKCGCNIIPSVFHTEKPSIGNDDVFDRIDRELTSVRNDIGILFSNCTSYVRVHDSLHKMIIERDDKIKSLEDRITLFGSNECAMNNKIEILETDRINSHIAWGTALEKIKSLEEKITESIDLELTKLRIQTNRLDQIEQRTETIYHDCLTKIKSLEEKENHNDEMRSSALSDFASRMNKIEKYIEINFANMYQLIAKIESKEKIQFENESAEDYRKRIDAVSLSFTSELRENYDKAINLIKEIGYGNASIGLYNDAQKLLKELGEIE